MVVAAAGNEFEEGNPVSYPAAWPHVLSVAATARRTSPPFFSSANASIDVAAPGEDLPLAIPGALDTTDGAQDGITVGSGTSFAAPIVAGAVAWLRAARPEVSNGQAADLLRRNADRHRPAGLGPGQRLRPHQPRERPAAPRCRAIDPLEPNDSIAEIDGTVFAGRRRPRSGAAGRAAGSPASRSTPSRTRSTSTASASRPGRAGRSSPGRAGPGPATPISRSTTARPSVALAAALQRRAQRPRRGQADSVTLDEPRPAARTMYVVVYVPEEARYADAAYRLEFSRQPFPALTAAVVSSTPWPALPSPSPIPQRLAAIRDAAELLADYL